jgi:hypothetical protein
MNTTIGCELRKLAKCESFISSTLSSESSISMTLEVEYSFPVLFKSTLIIIDLCSGLSHRD